MTTAYVLMEPRKNNEERVYAVFEDLEEAKESARNLRKKFEDKGWESWANRVSLRIPSPQLARELANKLIDEGNTIDMMNQSRTFRGDSQVIAVGSMEAKYHWAGLLRKHAKSA